MQISKSELAYLSTKLHYNIELNQILYKFGIIPTLLRISKQIII